jgi:hypothetical protein
VPTKPNYARGRVNHVVVQEAHEASDVMLGTFLINATIAIVLFDLRVFHSFIFATYVEKHNLPISLLKCQMIFNSPGGDMPTRKSCPKMNLKIRGEGFVANLIILDSKGLDVILGMDWLSKHKSLIDYAKKYVKLTTKDGKELEHVTESLVTGKEATNRVKLNQLEASWGQDGPVVNEFPEVFPKELSGMLSDRHIKFVIELVPDMTPIYKRPYRIPAKQLAELKY